MSDSFNHIDEIFKKGLKDAQVPAPSNAFAQIQNEVISQGLQGSHTLSQIGTGVKGLTLKYAVISVLTLVSSVVGFYMYEGFDSSSLEVSTSEELFAAEVHPKKDSLPTAFSYEMNEILNTIEKKASQEKNKISPTQNKRSDVETRGIRSENSTQEIRSTKNTEAVFIASGVQEPSPGKENPSKSDGMKLLPLMEQKLRPSLSQVDCRGKKLDVELSDDIAGLHELSMKVSGDIGVYEWGCKNEIWGNKTAKNWGWKGPIYVKKSQELTFWLKVNYHDGCKDSMALSRWFQPENNDDEELFPTVFTPNEDGYNDSFYVKIPRPKTFEMIVMDPTGFVVFQTKDSKEKWGGRCGSNACHDGLYTVLVRRTYYGGVPLETKTYKLTLKRD
jgi:hypothetical protein